jgi:hypothetical protein
MKGILLTYVIDWDLFVKALAPIATIVAAILVYTFAKKNMQYETKERLNRYKKEKLLEAGMGFWGLLAYTTQSENPLSILWWTREKGNGNTKYFIHVENAKAFIVALNKINYEKGYGLFLSTHARELFYEYRNILYGFLLANKGASEEKILVENEQMIQRMKQIHDDAITVLKSEMELIKPSL